MAMAMDRCLCSHLLSYIVCRHRALSTVSGSGLTRAIAVIILVVIQSGRRERKMEARDERKGGIKWEAKADGRREGKEEAE